MKSWSLIGELIWKRYTTGLQLKCYLLALPSEYRIYSSCEFKLHGNPWSCKLGKHILASCDHSLLLMTISLSNIIYTNELPMFIINILSQLFFLYILFAHYWPSNTIRVSNPVRRWPLPRGTHAWTNAHWTMSRTTGFTIPIPLGPHHGAPMLHWNRTKTPI